MEDFTLSPKELLFLCASLGVTEVYGVEDAYKDIDLSDLSNEIRAVQRSLEKKGYIESDFDGNSSVRPDLMDYVSVCVTCQKLISVVCRQKSGESSTEVYYFSQEKAIQSEKQGGLYHLRTADKAAICEEVKRRMQICCAENTLSFTKVNVPQKKLDKMKRLLLTGARKEAVGMIQEYFEADAADIILRGLEEKESFYSVVAVEFTAGANNVQNVMILGADTGNIRLKPTVTDLVTEVEFESVDRKTVYRLVDECFHSILTGGDDND